MSTAKIDGVELYYERAGQGERVVMTHGAWSDGRAWQAVSERLVERFEVVTWDRRGHSRSQDGPGPGSVHQDASDLAGLLEHLDGEPAHLVGNSSGGVIALNVVIDRPDLVRHVSVHEPVLLALVEEGDADLERQITTNRRQIQEVQRLIAAGRNQEAARYFVENVAVGPGAWEHFPLDQQEILTANAPTAADDLRDSFDPASLDIAALAASETPISVTWGTHGPGLEAAAAQSLAERLPRARVDAMEGAGHVPHRTHPAEYATLLTSILTNAPAASRTD